MKRLLSYNARDRSIFGERAKFHTSPAGYMKHYMKTTWLSLPLFIVRHHKLWIRHKARQQTPCHTFVRYHKLWIRHKTRQNWHRSIRVLVLVLRRKTQNGTNEGGKCLHIAILHDSQSNFIKRSAREFTLYFAFLSAPAGRRAISIVQGLEETRQKKRVEKWINE